MELKSSFAQRQHPIHKEVEVSTSVSTYNWVRCIFLLTHHPGHRGVEVQGSCCSPLHIQFSSNSICPLDITILIFHLIKRQKLHTNLHDTHCKADKYCRPQLMAWYTFASKPFGKNYAVSFFYTDAMLDLVLYFSGERGSITCLGKNNWPTLWGVEFIFHHHSNYLGEKSLHFHLHKRSTRLLNCTTEETFQGFLLYSEWEKCRHKYRKSISSRNLYLEKCVGSSKLYSRNKVQPKRKPPVIKEFTMLQCNCCYVSITWQAN